MEISNVVQVLVTGELVRIATVTMLVGLGLRAVSRRHPAGPHTPTPTT